MSNPHEARSLAFDNTKLEPIIAFSIANVLGPSKLIADYLDPQRLEDRLQEAGFSGTEFWHLGPPWTYPFLDRFHGKHLALAVTAHQSFRGESWSDAAKAVVACVGSLARRDLALLQQHLVPLVAYAGMEHLDSSLGRLAQLNKQFSAMAGLVVYEQDSMSQPIDFNGLIGLGNQVLVQIRPETLTSLKSQDPQKVLSGLKDQGVTGLVYDFAHIARIGDSINTRDLFELAGRQGFSLMCHVGSRSDQGFTLDDSDSDTIKWLWGLGARYFVIESRPSDMGLSPTTSTDQVWAKYQQVADSVKTAVQAGT